MQTTAVETPGCAQESRDPVLLLDDGRRAATENLDKDRSLQLPDADRGRPRHLAGRQIPGNRAQAFEGTHTHFRVPTINRPLSVSP